MGRKADQTRQQILELSCPVFVAKGFKAVTMKDICEATGLSRGGLYRYYGSTREIFADLLDSMLTGQEDEFIRSMENGISAVVLLDQVLARYEAEMLDAAHSLSIALFEYYTEEMNQYGNDLIAIQTEASVEMWKKLIHYGQEQDEFHPEDVEAVISLLLFSYQGVRLYSSVLPMERTTIHAMLQQIRMLLIR